MCIHFIDPLEDALPEFIERSDPDVAQEGARHFREDRLDQIQPGSVFRRVNILEASRVSNQPGHCFLRDVGAVVVQHDTDECIRRIMLMQPLQQADELAAAMAILDFGNNLAGVQV
ncbi:hypothetical protein X890_5665 [Burkholderia pseudomallei MSHR4299]|nr:hypothetical protein X890_5665 [Burkholderia pseudomallei MSHR4299]